MKILINGLQAAHIAEIAHRQSVGIPAKEWGSIPCVMLVAVNLTAWKGTQIWWYGGIGRCYIAVDSTE